MEMEFVSPEQISEPGYTRTVNENIYVHPNGAVIILIDHNHAVKFTTEK